MIKPGSVVYYVDSLAFPATRCVVQSVRILSDTRKSAVYVTARTARGETIEGMRAKFTSKKPRKYTWS